MSTGDSDGVGVAVPVSGTVRVVSRVGLPDWEQLPTALGLRLTEEVRDGVAVPHALAVRVYVADGCVVTDEVTELEALQVRVGMCVLDAEADRLPVREWLAVYRGVTVRDGLMLEDSEADEAVGDREALMVALDTDRDRVDAVGVVEPVGDAVAVQVRGTVRACVAVEVGDGDEVWTGLCVAVAEPALRDAVQVPERLRVAVGDGGDAEREAEAEEPVCVRVGVAGSEAVRLDGVMVCEALEGEAVEEVVPLRVHEKVEAVGLAVSVRECETVTENNAERVAIAVWVLDELRVGARVTTAVPVSVPDDDQVAVEVLNRERLPVTDGGVPVRILVMDADGLREADGDGGESEGVQLRVCESECVGDKDHVRVGRVDVPVSCTLRVGVAVPEALCVRVGSAVWERDPEEELDGVSVRVRVQLWVCVGEEVHRRERLRLAVGDGARVADGVPEYDGMEAVWVLALGVGEAVAVGERERDGDRDSDAEGRLRVAELEQDNDPHRLRDSVALKERVPLRVPLVVGDAVEAVVVGL